VVFQERLIKNLEKKANIIRRYIIEMISNAEGGHIGGALSIADIMAILYFHILKIDPENSEWEDRDRVVFFLKVMLRLPGMLLWLRERVFP
jgi:transketolase